MTKLFLVYGTKMHTNQSLILDHYTFLTDCKWNRDISRRPCFYC